MDGKKFIQEHQKYLKLSAIPTTGALRLGANKKLVLITSDNVKFTGRSVQGWIAQSHASACIYVGLGQSYYTPDFVFTFNGDEVDIAMEFMT